MSARPCVGLAARAVLVVAAAAAPLRAQSAEQSASGIAHSLQGDYAVPEAPALLMLGLDNSKLLRPSSARELSAALASGTGTFSYIPTAFGVEGSPAMLARGERLSIGEYQANPWLYRLRVSLAANRDSVSKRSQAAIAFRMSFSDQSDLRTNPAVLQAFRTLTRLQVDSAHAVLLALSAAGVPQIEPRTPAQQKRYEAVVKAVMDSMAQSTARSDALAQLKRAREAALWNAGVFDAAVGVKGSSADSAGRGSRFDGVAGWLTKGWALHTDWTQLLLGARGAYERDSTGAKLEGSGDVIARLYAGSNRYKALLEGQVTKRGKADLGSLLRMGGEFEVAKPLWVEFAVGWEAKGSFNKGTFTHSVKLEMAPPTT